MLDDLIAKLYAKETADDAVEQLIVAGVATLPALAALARTAEHPETVRRLAVTVMRRISPLGVDQLMAFAVGEDEDVADLACWGLRWPPVSFAAEKVFLQLLDSGAAQRRLRGLRGLRYIGPDLTELDARILAAARDADPAMRVLVAEILDVVDDASEAAMSAHARLCEDRDPTVREAALRARRRGRA